MLARTEHRGPDDSGVFQDEDIVLGHNRLSIIDLSDLAAQPMRSSDGKFVISFNGEIFNFVDLRKRLEEIGHAVRSTGDTEVLLEHLAHFGVDDTLPRIEGDWAFALWDAEERRLVLARDLHGVKPMYYAEKDGTVRFSSEMKVLVGGARDPDWATLNACLLGYAGTWGERTVFRGIRSLRPGEVVVFDRSGEILEQRVFADATDFVDDALAQHLLDAPEDEVVSMAADAFRESIELRMISDAPLACLASGGVDSSLIASLAGDVNPDMTLFHADVRADSERPAAESLARSLRLDLFVESVDDQAFVDSIASATWFNDVPLTYHFNSVPFFLVSQLARREGIKVLLTGEGSDEYFLGYPHLALAPVLERLQRTKSLARRGMSRISGQGTNMLWPEPTDRFPDLLATLSTRYERAIVRDDSRAIAQTLLRPDDQRSAETTLDLVQNHLLSLLHRNDRLGMASSLESRFPFLGHRLASLAVNMPSRYKLRRTRRVHDRRHPFVIDKWIIRELAARHVPADLAQRPKRGFPVSVDQRLDIDAAYFEGGFVADQFGLDRDAARRLVATPRRVWPTRVLLLDVWGRMFVHEEPPEVVQERLGAFVSLRT